MTPAPALAGSNCARVHTKANSAMQKQQKIKLLYILGQRTRTGNGASEVWIYRTGRGMHACAN